MRKPSTGTLKKLRTHQHALTSILERDRWLNRPFPACLHVRNSIEDAIRHLRFAADIMESKISVIDGAKTAVTGGIGGSAQRIPQEKQ